MRMGNKKDFNLMNCPFLNDALKNPVTVKTFKYKIGFLSFPDNNFGSLINVIIN